MSSKHALRSRKNRQASRSSLRLESLEPRLALAVIPVGGNVNAQLLGSTLLLTGDAFDNALVLSTATGGRMAVLGGLGTTINGSTSTFVTSRAVTSIVANLNAGNDVIGFTNSAVGLINQLTAFGMSSPFALTLQDDINSATGGIPAFTLPGSVTVTTASGNDVVGIIGTVVGSVAANLGSSSSLTSPGQGNRFAIGDPFASSVANRVGGSVSVVGGDQRDGIRITGTDVGGVVAAALGNGLNAAGIDGYGSSIGSFVYTGGTGNDAVFFEEPLTIRNGVSVFTGASGRDSVEIFATAIGGSVVVNTGTGADRDFIDIQVEAAIRGGLSVITGAGDDSIYVESRTIGGGLAMNSGAGDDYVGCDSTSVALNTVIDTGAGNDRVFSIGLTTRYYLFVYQDAGNDELLLYNSRAFAAFLYGGAGTNSLTTNAATRSGIRTLRYYQFQTVNNS